MFNKNFKRITTIFSTATLSSFIILSNFSILFAAEPIASWKENNASLAIYNNVKGDGFNEMEYNDIKADKTPVTDKIHLLMINGGFVPNPNLVFKDGKANIPLSTLNNILGEKTNDKNISTEIINSTIYVPLRACAESLGCTVIFIANYYSNADYKDIGNEAVNADLITVEDNKSKQKYTEQQGLESVIKASNETYSSLKDYMKTTKQVFGEDKKDYDPNDITYNTGYDVGRYYTYTLKGVERFPIYFNKYTGEIYSGHLALPIFDMDKGFINIGFGYQ